MPKSLEVRGNGRLVADILNSCPSVAIQLFRAIPIVYVFLPIPRTLSADFQTSEDTYVANVYIAYRVVPEAQRPNIHPIHVPPRDL